MDPKATKVDADRSGVGQKKFFCGRKHKFGLNCQAVSDKRGKFLDLSIRYGGASSDCLAFEASELWQRLEDGLLAPGLVLFGDNAYLNTSYMATPFTNVSRGSKDDYNFFHSQVSLHSNQRTLQCFELLFLSSNYFLSSLLSFVVLASNSH